MRIHWRWIVVEMVALFGIGYAIALAGTLNGLTTPQLETVTLALMVVAGALWVRHVYRQPRPLPPLTLPLMGIGAALVIATLFSQDARRSAMQVGYWAAVTLAYWLLAEQEQDRLIRALLVTILLLTAVGWIYVWWWWQGGGVGAPPRPPGGVGNPNILATILLVGIGLMGHRLMAATRWRMRVAAAALLIILGSTLVLTGSRAAWVGGATGGGVYLSLAWRRLRRAERLGIVGVVVITGAVLAPLIASQAAHPTHAPLLDRVALWQAAWEAFTSSPLVGVGPFTFGSTLMRAISVPPEPAHTHAHNLILQIAAETGVVGLAALGWIFWESYRRIQEAKSTDSARAEAAAALAAAIAGNALLDFTFYPSVALLCLLGFQALLPPTGPSAAPAWHAGARRMLAPTVLAIAALLWGGGLPGEFAALEGVRAAEEGNWEAAARHLDRASRRDPALLAYRFSGAYAYAHLTLEGDENALEEAINRYQSALAEDPAYALHWAELAILEWRAGEEAAALAHIRLAHSLAPQAEVLTGLESMMLGETSTLPESVTLLGKDSEYGWHLYHVPSLWFDLPSDALEVIIVGDVGRSAPMPGE